MKREMKAVSWNKTNSIKKILAVLVSGAVMLSCMAACAANTSKSTASKSSKEFSTNISEEKPLSTTVGVKEDTQYGSVIFRIKVDEFNGLGFKLGDSCDIVFSNGYKLDSVPYYNGYYTHTGDPVIVSYPGNEYVLLAFSNGDLMWETAGCKEGDTVTVTLQEQGAYQFIQESMSMVYSPDRNDYDSDEMFANYRVMKGGNLAKNKFFRGASPVDNQNNRAAYSDALLKKDGIRFILDLADTEEKIQGYLNKDDFKSDYSAGLLKEGLLKPLGLNASYRSEVFMKKLADGLRTMMHQEGPYYIHCVEGKDRTGFVCLLMEALCGATYDELRTDYMTTYANYYRLTQESDSEKYNAVLHLRMDDMLIGLPGVEEESFTGSEVFTENAKAYLEKAGMTKAEIDNLIQYLTTGEAVKED